MHINVALRSLLQGSEHILKGAPSLLPQSYLNSAFLLLPQTLLHHFPLLSLSANSIHWQPLQSSSIYYFHSALSLLFISNTQRRVRRKPNIYDTKFLSSGVFIGVITHCCFYSDHKEQNSCFFCPLASLHVPLRPFILSYLMLLYFVALYNAYCR